jgi:glycosyltransferase involved in cell wall biosynthesis
MVAADSVPRVLMILSCYPPIVGGGERQAHLLARGLVSRGIEVRVLTRRYPSLPEFECVDGVPVYRIPVWGKRWVQALAFVLRAFMAMRVQDIPSRTTLRAPILHCHQSSLGIAPTVIAVLIKLFDGGNVIVKFMGSRVHEMADTRSWLVRRWLLRQVDAFVVTNEGTGRALRDMGLDVPAYCLPNGVDTKRFQPVASGAQLQLRKRLGLPEAIFVVLFVGRLEPVKGSDVLLRAWSRLVGQNPARSLLLALVGDGSERDRLIRLSQELDIASSVRFVGLSDRVIDWLHGADLFVLPSRSEGLSNALLEAMSCGLPTVATAVGGTPEVIEDGTNGLLVPANDDGALADALLCLIENPDLARRLGNAARKTIGGRYSMEATVDRYIELYKRLARQ